MDRKKGQLSQNVETTSDNVRLNIMTMGEPGVGKSCLVKRLCENKFIDSYISTIGIDYGLKPIQVNGETVKVNFWDTAGDPIYHEIRKEFYKDVDGLLLVCDATDRLTFQRVEKWLKDFSSFNTKAKKVLACSKSDLNPKAVSVEELEEFKTTYQYEYFVVSSFDGYQVEPLFDHLFKMCLETARQKSTDDQQESDVS